MLCRIRMLCRLRMLCRIRMPEPYHNTPPYRHYGVSLPYYSMMYQGGTHSHSILLTASGGTQLQLLKPLIHPLQVHLFQVHLLQVQVLRAFDLQTKMSNQTSDLPTLVQSFQRNFNSDLFTNLPPPPHPRQTPPHKSWSPSHPHPDHHQSTHSSNSTYFNLMHSNLQLTLL